MTLRGIAFGAVLVAALSATPVLFAAPALSAPPALPARAAPLPAAPLTAIPARATPPGGTDGNQLYYTVTASYQGAPENLWEIADRFLGDARRAGEILELNAGRTQPDGGRLADPGRLRAGWQLILPWDAVGTDLRDGPLPGGAEADAACEWETHLPAAASWGQALLTPNRAWQTAAGAGVTVAVVGSGVDGSAPALAGRVATGTDIAAGSGRGDTGCGGSGTALAGIVAGDDGAAGSTFGVAPKARIAPIKLGAARPSARLAATGIDVAAGSGARVVLVGVGVDATNPEVRAAVNDAISRDVVVVLPASAGAERVDGLLRVGAIASDRRPADDYPDGAVDLLAPGVDVASVGGSVTGAEYAAAFVAGTAALVRSAHPELHAADVSRHLLGTVTDGVVGPVSAVTAPLPSGVGVNAVPVVPPSGPGTLSRVLLWSAVGVAVLLLLPSLLQRPMAALRRAVAERGANRRAQQTRARLAADGDDPFWEPPTTSPAPTALDEPTEIMPTIR